MLEQMWNLFQFLAKINQTHYWKQSVTSINMDIRWSECQKVIALLLVWSKSRFSDSANTPPAAIWVGSLLGHANPLWCQIKSPQSCVTRDIWSTLVVGSSPQCKGSVGPWNWPSASHSAELQSNSCFCFIWKSKLVWILQADFWMIVFFCFYKVLIRKKFSKCWSVMGQMPTHPCSPF